MAGQACKYGTTDACTYDSSTHTVTCPGRTPVARPATAAWDDGAYQCVPEADGGCATSAPTDTLYIE